MSGKTGWNNCAVCVKGGEIAVANRRNNHSPNAVFIKETFWADAR